MRAIWNSSLAVCLAFCALGPGAAPARAAVAENIAYDLGAIRFLIPRIEASGSPLSDADFKALLDVNTPETLAQRLGRLNAASISAPQMILEIKAGSNVNRIVYSDLKITGVADGMVETAGVAGAGGVMADPNGGEMKITYGAMTLRKINLALMLRLYASRRSDPNEPLASVYEDFSADGFQMTSKDADISVGKMTGSGIRARALAAPLGDILALSKEMGPPGSKPSPEQMQRIFSILGDFMQSVEIGRVEARDMKVRVKKEPGEIGIGRIFMGGFGGGRLAEIAYENLSMDMPDGKAKLARFGLRGLDLARAFAAMADALRRGDTEFKNTNPRLLIPTLAQFQIAGLDLDVPDKLGQGNSEDGKRVLFSLGNFEINAGGYIDGIPSALTASLSHLLFPVPSRPADPRLEGLAAMGITKIDLSHGMDILWSEASREIGIREYSIDLGGLGSARLSGIIGNVPKDLFSSNMALVQAAAFGALIQSADLKIINLGIFEKALAMQAGQTSQTPAQLQQTLVAGAAMGVTAMLGGGTAARDLGNALAKFAAEPKNLRITARAKAGLGASDLMLLSNPAALLEKLEVSAAANE